MGCGIACAASLAGLSYREMRDLFTDGEIKDKTVGFYNSDFVEALEKLGIKAVGCSAEEWENKILKPGTIVFIKRSRMYPAGHFLLKTTLGWMDPWKTGTTIKNAKAGYRENLPGQIDWVIETTKN